MSKSEHHSVLLASQSTAQKRIMQWENSANCLTDAFHTIEVKDYRTAFLL